MQKIFLSLILLLSLALSQSLTGWNIYKRGYINICPGTNANTEEVFTSVCQSDYYNTSRIANNLVVDDDYNPISANLCTYTNDRTCSNSSGTGTCQFYNMNTCTSDLSLLIHVSLSANCDPTLTCQASASYYACCYNANDQPLNTTCEGSCCPTSCAVGRPPVAPPVPSGSDSWPPLTLDIFASPTCPGLGSNANPVVVKSFVLHGANCTSYGNYSFYYSQYSGSFFTISKYTNGCWNGIPSTDSFSCTYQGYCSPGSSYSYGYTCGANFERPSMVFLFVVMLIKFLF